MKEYLKNSFKSWYHILEGYLNSPEFLKIGQEIAVERTKYNVFPDRDLIFEAFNKTDYKDLKVIWIGQDPYPTKGHAIGLSFGINPDVKIPLSLRELVQEMERDLDTFILDYDYSLINWANQGILLLNTSLTVKEGIPNSHMKVWEPFTKHIISVLNTKQDLIWVLLGNNAQALEPLINKNHMKIKAPHPAAVRFGSSGVRGSKIFSRINEQLEAMNLSPINWTNQEFPEEMDNRKEHQKINDEFEAFLNK